MISFDDHRLKNGHIDWRSYTAAQVAAGEKCSTCLEHIILNRTPGPTDCVNCRGLVKDEELTHNHFIRCPDCGEHWNPFKQEDYHVHEDGEHNVSCCNCNYGFEVSTMVTFTFTSPKRLKKD